MFWPVRTRRGLSTYRPEERPTSFKIGIKQPDGEFEDVTIPAHEHPGLFELPILGTPQPIPTSQVNILRSWHVYDDDAMKRLIGGRDNVTSISSPLSIPLLSFS